MGVVQEAGVGSPEQKKKLSDVIKRNKAKAEELERQQKEEQENLYNEMKKNAYEDVFSEALVFLEELLDDDIICTDLPVSVQVSDQFVEFWELFPKKYLLDNALRDEIWHGFTEYASSRTELDLSELTLTHWTFSERSRLFQMKIRVRLN